MDRMTKTLILSILTLYLTVSHLSCHYRCGPEKKCKCYQDKHAKDNITMDCSEEKFKSLAEICKHTGNVTNLDASLNEINGVLFDDIRLSGCHFLLSLSLSNNSITDVEQSALGKMSKLKNLDLSFNSLEMYTPEKGKIFENLAGLESLKLNGNNASHSDTSSYPDLSRNKNLSTLYIDGIKDGVFNKSYSMLKNLKTLVLSGCNGKCDIENISDSFFDNLLQLESINLSCCAIAEISPNAFKRTGNLQSLDLSNNRQLGLRALFNVSYSLQFTNIQFLDYSHVYNTFGLGNEVTKFDLCFLRNTTLRELVLNGNRIQLFETNSLQLLPPTLNILHINDNTFTFGPYLLQIACVGNISEFYGNFQNVAHDPFRYTEDRRRQEQTPNYHIECPFVEENYLRNVSNHTKYCKFYEHDEKISLQVPSIPKTLRKVEFHDCNMKYEIIPFFVNPPQNNIEYIDVSGNIFYEWTGPVGPLASLKYLDLSRNYCSKIKDGFFEYFPSLENLQMHSNFIGLYLTSGDSVNLFRGLTSLKTLNLSMSKITDLHPKSLRVLGNLETLDLSLNGIDNWVLEVNTLSNLTNIDLHNNALHSLPSSLTNHLSQMSSLRGTHFSVDLRNNILKYSCQTKEFLLWMLDHRSSFVGFKEYVFKDDDGKTIPAHDIESRVKDLRKKCQSYTIWIVISSIGVSVALSVIVVGLLYRNRWKIRYFMYMSKQRFYGYVRVPNETPLENFKYDAFISYAEESIHFVKDQLIPKVEHDGISLCVHQRDFLPGNTIADNILDAIQSSRKTVVLLTKAFLRKKWCIYEFNMARMESIYSRDGRSCLLIAMLEDVPTKHMPPELMDWLKTESYLEYSTDEMGKCCSGTV